MRILTVLTVLCLCIPVHAQSAHSPDDKATDPFADIHWTVPDPPADVAMFSAARRSQGEAHPAPRHTGFKALLFETASDFNAFPRRTSTWVILGIGGAAAAGAHPFDATVNQKLVGSETADAFFKAGKYIGAAYVQAGAAVGLYVVGRYVMPHAADAPKTNKVSH